MTQKAGTARINLTWLFFQTFGKSNLDSVKFSQSKVASDK